MAWKQDLAKLKQQLPPEEPAPASKAPPKVPARPGGPAPLAEEDAVFLSAMGLRSSAPKAAKPIIVEPEFTTPPPEGPAPVAAPTPDTFQDAIRDLKGLKPIQKGMLEHAASTQKASAPPAKESPRAVASPDLPPAPVAPPAQEQAAEPVGPAAHSTPVPIRFQLAAGMAIEVDGSLDLRGHSLADALDRLQDRLGDGMVLGWRSLQVNLGTDPALHEGLLALLASGQVPMVTRFAQAPVPMGGTQAWLLYFGPQPAQPATPRRES